MMEEKNNASTAEEIREEDSHIDEPEIEVPDKNEEEPQTEEAAGEHTELVNKLEQDIAQLKEEKDEFQNKMLRIQAEFDNFKKRTQKERQAERKYQAQDIVNDLLPAIDNFERALQIEVTDETASFVEGMEMIYRQIKDALASQGVEEIESVGAEFDPNIHHAVMQVEDEEKDSNIIVEEMQKGYMLKDRVIRPAMVKVNK